MSSQRCCITGCRTNYDPNKPTNHVFSLPRNETIRKLWLRHIPSELHHLNPVVCIKHFTESTIIRSDTVLMHGNSVTVVPRTKPKLKENAFPTIFPESVAIGRSVFHQPYLEEQYGRHWQGGSVLPQGTGVNSNPLEMAQNPSAQAPGMMPNSSMRVPPMGGFMPLTDQIRARNNHHHQQYMNLYGYQPNKVMGMNNPVMNNPALMPPMTTEVKLKKLPFFDHLGELLKPSALNSLPSVREGSANFVFFLTPTQASEVSMNREVGPGTRNEYIVQIQLRFCALDHSTEQDDQFPPGINVKVNGKIVQLPNLVTKQGAEPKRPSRPVHISHHVKLCPSVANNLTITWTPDYQRGFCAAVNLVRKLSSQELLDRLKAKSPKNVETTRALIKEKLNDSDNDIATTVLRVSLSCPLGKMRMQTPCRSNTCNHLQCFDAGVFLSMNEKRPTWSCPVCNKPAIYDTLVIDGYFKEVLDSPLLGDSLEIELNKDGSWSPYDESKESSSSSSLAPSKAQMALSVDSPKTAEHIEEINDDDDDDPPAENGDTRVSSTSEKTDEPGKEKEKEKDGEMTLVDLTETDDDEPAPAPPAPQQVTKEGATTPNTVMPPIFTDPLAPTAPRTEPSIINLDSPSPSPPMSNFSNTHGAPGVATPPPNFLCHVRLGDTRYHPY